jgi:hypothetical protein
MSFVFLIHKFVHGSYPRVSSWESVVVAVLLRLSLMSGWLMVLLFLEVQAFAHFSVLSLLFLHAFKYSHELQKFFFLRSPILAFSRLPSGDIVRCLFSLVFYFVNFFVNLS